MEVLRIVFTHSFLNQKSHSIAARQQLVRKYRTFHEAFFIYSYPYE